MAYAIFGLSDARVAKFAVSHTMAFSSPPHVSKRSSWRKNRRPWVRTWPLSVRRRPSGPQSVTDLRGQGSMRSNCMAEFGHCAFFYTRRESVILRAFVVRPHGVLDKSSKRDRPPGDFGADIAMSYLILQKFGHPVNSSQARPTPDEVGPNSGSAELAQNFLKPHISKLVSSSPRRGQAVEAQGAQARCRRTRIGDEPAKPAQCTVEPQRERPALPAWGHPVACAPTIGELPMGV